ncbi:MAG: diacylglycerol kinase family protein [Clostridia bacterium]|nr:diacylglycerol kinase family protein [Clostridia bacterium]
MVFLKSLKFAISGILYVIKNERNMRFHTVAGLYVLIFSLFFSLSMIKYVVLLLMISLVLVTEILNTCIEYLIDLFSKEYNSVAKVVKDMAAGAVLIVCTVAVAVALLFFSEPDAYVRMWAFLCTYPVVIVPFLIFSFICYEYIFLGPIEVKNRLKKYFDKIKKSDANERE